MPRILCDLFERNRVVSIFLVKYLTQKLLPLHECNSGLQREQMKFRDFSKRLLVRDTLVQSLEKVRKATCGK